MKQIEMKNGYVAIVDDEDYSVVAMFTWCRNSGGYAVTNTYPGGVQRQVLMHRMILNAGANEVVDHINHDKLDNRRSNIRLCLHRQNQRNQLPQQSTASKFKGVTYDKLDWCKLKPWMAQIKRDGKRKTIGHFATEFEAAKAYDTAAAILFGDFALLNDGSTGVNATDMSVEHAVLATKVIGLTERHLSGWGK